MDCKYSLFFSNMVNLAASKYTVLYAVEPGRNFLDLPETSWQQSFH